ncbi:hypothetical protein HHI36_018511 [Cryptolaemus montrouzieri]|uniref:Uncharacterized protein n=1 Tax=Cryptolaemus montrouzieri TaxID=559131 RepID=A0ABD2P053_9CUCU
MELSLQDFNLMLHNLDEKAKIFCDFLGSYGHVMMNDRPTRGKNCIANVCINFSQHNISSQVVNTDFSDNNAILISVEQPDMLVSNPGTKKISPRTERGFNASFNILSSLSWISLRINK